MDRNTRQRNTIQLVFKAAERPLTVQEVLDDGQKILPTLGIATVYRAVKTLLEENWLVTVQIPGEGVYYEPAGKTHHHHFRCRECARVFELSGCLPNLTELMPPGFSFEGHDIVLYGRCSSCSRKRARLRKPEARSTNRSTPTRR
jgi:Fur family ferric uptake transcriptional regulator